MVRRLREWVEELENIRREGVEDGEWREVDKDIDKVLILGE